MFFVAGATHSEPVTRTVLTGRGVPCRISWKGKSRSSPGGNSSIGLATLLAVHLIRNASTPGPPPRPTSAAPRRGTHPAAVEPHEGHLKPPLPLVQGAAAPKPGACRFARRFKAATGLPPPQYVRSRRVERAKQLLQTGSDFS